MLPSNTPSLDRLHSPPQMASGSNQPFCHGTLSGHKDGRTDGIGDRRAPIALTLHRIGRLRRANDIRRLQIALNGVAGIVRRSHRGDARFHNEYLPSTAAHESVSLYDTLRYSPFQ